VCVCVCVCVLTSDQTKETVVDVVVVVYKSVTRKQLRVVIDSWHVTWRKWMLLIVTAV